MATSSDLKLRLYICYIYLRITVVYILLCLNFIEHKGKENKGKEDKKEDEKSSSYKSEDEKDKEENLKNGNQAGSSEDEGTHTKDYGMYLTSCAVYIM